MAYRRDKTAQNRQKLIRRMAITGLFAVGLAALPVATSLIYVLHNGTPVPAPVIPRNSMFGQSGSHLNYIVLGDSTSIGQGAAYEDSYAYQSAQHLAINHRVSLTNAGVSGARVHDVATKQLPKLSGAKLDVVLLAVGANDVTHFTSEKSFSKDLTAIFDTLRRDNCNVRIVVTGVPAMGSVPRFPIGLKQLAKYRTDTFNELYATLNARSGVIMAPIAAKTGAVFAKDHTLFAADKFHPNARGYELWTPVINQALDSALQSTPGHCSQ